MMGIGIGNIGISRNVGGVFGIPYIEKVLSIESGNLIGFWPLNETAGITADNAEGTAARDGTYTGVTLNDSIFVDGNPVGRWDIVNDYCDIFSASLQGVFNGSEGTISLWIKVFDSGVWTNGFPGYGTWLQATAANSVGILKTAANNTLQWWYRAGGTISTRITAGHVDTGWIHLAITWSATNDQVIAYKNGVQEGAILTGLGVFAGSLNAAATVIGATNTIPSNVFNGWIANLALWTAPLLPANISDLAIV